MYFVIWQRVFNWHLSLPNNWAIMITDSMKDNQFEKTYDLQINLTAEEIGQILGGN